MYYEVRMSFLALLLLSFCQQPPVDIKATDLAVSSTEHVNGVVSQWQEISDSVITARVECRHLLLHCKGSDASACPSQPEMVQFLRRELVPCLGSPDEAEKISEITARLLADNGLVGGWNTLAVVSGNTDQLRNDEGFGTHGNRIRVRERGQEVYYSSDIAQAGVSSQQSSVRMYSLNDVWFLPKTEFFTLDGSLRGEFAPGSIEHIIQGGFRIEFNAETFFVSRVSWTKPTGGLTYEVLQELPQTIDGYDVPYVSATFHYKPYDGKDRVHLADIFIVDAAVFNLELGDGAFQISLPTGTVVANETYDKSVPSVFQTESPVSDVATALPQLAADNVKPTQRFSRLSLLMFNVLILVALAVFFTLRYFFRIRREHVR